MLRQACGRQWASPVIHVISPLRVVAMRGKGLLYVASQVSARSVLLGVKGSFVQKQGALADAAVGHQAMGRQHVRD